MKNVQVNPQVDPADVNRTNTKLVAVIIVLAVVTTLALVVAAFALGGLSSNNSEVKSAAVETLPTNSGPCGDYPFTSLRKVVFADVASMEESELRIMRNEIYARHGYIFDSKDMHRHFSSKDWYCPISKNVTLSAIEKSNVEYIKGVEDCLEGEGEFLPGVCQKLTYADLVEYDKELLRLMRNQPYAIHGYIFDSKDLRDYFSQFHWYRPVTKNVELTEIEKYNVALIKRYEKENFGE